MMTYLLRMRERKELEIIVGNLDNYTDIMSEFLDK